jgi:hypothetical protein
MKRIVLVGFVLLTQFSFGQITIKLDDFDDVKTFDKLKVTLIASTENKAVITGESQAKVEVVNKKGLLKIRMPLTKMMTGDEAKVTIYFKRIQSIDANEGSEVSCTDTFKQTTFLVGTQEGAKVSVDLDVDKAEIKAYSGGIVRVKGKATTQSILINSGGSVDARDLETDQTTVSLSAGGNADVKATSLVDAKVKAGGTIIVHGKPKELRQETFAGGSIVQRD